MPAPEGNKYAEGNDGGRPTKYKDEYCDQAYKLCLLGATDKDLADFFEVDERTINNWKDQYEEFFQSLVKGKMLADANVADRLYQRALGFEHDSEEIKVISGGIAGSMIERVPIRKIYPPDTVAAKFWLMNRQPDKWREKTENLNKNINYNSTEMTPQEIKDISDALENEY
jgi:hypothetical protein